MTQLLVDQSDWGKIRVTGTDRARFLHGMCSADIENLPAGEWTRATVLNVKGRVVSVIEVMVADDHLLVICQPDLTDKTLAVLDKHIIMDDVTLEAVTLPLHRVWTDDVESVWTAPPLLEPSPGPAAGAAEVEVRRIEAGMPRYGVDVDEDCFPFESLLARHVSYDKGCYIGQEPIYRVHSRGQGARLMRGLAVSGDGPVAVGATVAHADRPSAGTITSAAVSPRFGSIALAYIHRSVWDPGNSVEVDGRPATLVELPFGSAA